MLEDEDKYLNPADAFESVDRQHLESKVKMHKIQY